jgi:rare lipoprotein A
VTPLLLQPRLAGCHRRNRCPHRAAITGLSATLVVVLSGCHHQTQVAYQPPPPTTQSTRTGHASISRQAPEADDTAAEAGVAEAPPGFFDDTTTPPVFTETGLASWYGPNYHHHAAADGTIFDQNAMTAAHRTLPLGSTVRVTNLATGQQVLVRITDRGPFAPGRVLDLSMGAAKAVGIYRAGIAQVRLEAFAHATADPPGRWCVQTGAFRTEHDALDLKAALIERYRGARVSEFQGPTGYWVRIDPSQASRTQASAIQDWIGAPDAQSQAYLVRID